MSGYFRPLEIAGKAYYGPLETPADASTVTSVTVSPTTITQATGTIQFTVTVNGTGGPSQATTAAISGPGSINSSNLYMLPAQTVAVQTATITWTSVQDSTKPPAVATVTIPAAGTAITATVQFHRIKPSKTKIVHFA